MHQHRTIDEAMIKFKGRLGFKQYVKDKPTKRDIMNFVLADATNGCLKILCMYILENDTSQVGLCTKVVLDLF